MVQLQRQKTFFLYIFIKLYKLFSISFEKTTSTPKTQILTKKEVFYYHRVVWVEKDVKDYLVPNSLPGAGNHILPYVDE